MRFDLAEKGPCERVVTIEVLPEAIQEEINREYSALSHKAKIKGFRSGHIPRPVLEQYFKADAESEALSRVINKAYQEVLKETDLKPLAGGHLEKSEPYAANKNFKFSISFEVLPTLALSYKGVTLQKKKSAVTENDVEEMVQQLRNSVAELRVREGAEALKQGDFAVVELSLEKSEKPQTQVIEVGAQLNPKIEEALIGMKLAEERTVSLPIGKEEKTVNIKLIEIKEKILPPLNDELAKTLQLGESLAELRVKIAESLTRNKERESRRDLEAQFLDRMRAGHEVPVPSTLVESEKNRFLSEFKQRWTERGGSEEEWKKSLDKLTKECHERAVQTAQAFLILSALAQDLKISISDEEIRERISQEAAENQMEFRKVWAFYQKNHDRMEDLVWRLTRERTLDWCLNQVTIKEEK